MLSATLSFPITLGDVPIFRNETHVVSVLHHNYPSTENQ
jgi:hypothetical protein